MTNPEILATLRKHEIRTVGDLDVWRESRRLSRREALAMMLGVSAADHVLTRMAVRKLESEGI